MAINKITVDPDLIGRKVQSFQDRLGRLRRFMEAVERNVDLLATAAWASPSSGVLRQKYRLLQRQVAEAVNIVEDYIHKLNAVRTQYANTERQVEERMDALRTDVFGV